MPFNAAGRFTRLYNWVSDRNNRVGIKAERMDNEFNGIADALTLLKNDTSAPGRGTKAAPAYPFDGDSDTGLYSTGADKIALSAGGVKALEIDPTETGAARLQMFGESVVAFLDLGTFETALSSLTAIDLQRLKANVGSIQWFATATLPTGWKECDGGNLDRTTYQELYDLIGVTYGGSGTNFKVPDLRRKAIIGRGGAQVTGPGTALGDTGGVEIAPLPLHSHGKGTLDMDDADLTHDHAKGTLAANGAGSHKHDSGTLVSGNTGTTRFTQLFTFTGNVAGAGSANSRTGQSVTTQHNHSISGMTGSGGSHSHDITGKTAEKALTHGHTLSGSTANAGIASPTNFQPSVALVPAIFTGVATPA